MDTLLEVKGLFKISFSCRTTAEEKKRCRAVVDTCGLDFYPHDDAGRLIVRMLFRKEASGSKCERHFAKVGEI